MTNTKYKKQFLLATVIVIGFLTSCSSTKSSTPAVTTLSSNPLLLSGKALAQCNQTTDSNFSFNSSVVTDQSGSVSNDWIKIKFSYLSTTVTSSGTNILRFYKWRVIAGASQLDSTPLTFALYDTSTGQTVSSSMTSIAANQITQTTGIYIQLNDPSGVYQVIKPVVYNSAGTVVAQVNSLIPAFYASPEDYKFNSDGTARADLLQQMHKLYGVNVSGYTSQQLTETFSQYCF